MTDERSTLLRARGDEAHRVTFFELFFDLVYVFSITQLSHGLIAQPDLRGFAETVVLLLAVWWAWVYTTWATNWLNPDSSGCRLMLIGVMGAGFKYTVFGVVSAPRLMAIAVLGALAPLAVALPPLLIGVAATLVVVGVAVHETFFHPAPAPDAMTVENA